jgi:porin
MRLQVKNRPETECLNKTEWRAYQVIASALSVLTLCIAAASAEGKEEPGSAGSQNAPTVVPSATPAGILPVPDYSGNFCTRQYLTDDWWGARTYLANKGIQVGVEWNQFVQGVTNGGRDRGTAYGANLDYTLNLDLMRMGLLPGALVKFRAETRYGSSVNGIAGPILPVNTKALFPVTAKINQQVGFTITDLNYTQFLSEHLALFFGKLDTLDADPNEFASGRGTSQFMNANFLFNPTLALRLPYSTLGAGVIWLPIPPGPRGGITINSSVVQTADSSETTGFENFGKGGSWTTEADFQYQLGTLPGGMNIGALYSFDQNFARLNTTNRLVLQPGEGLVIPSKQSTWAVYWSTWQYLFAKPPGDRPLVQFSGMPKQQGIGVFARFGFADRDTNPTEWAVSGGIGGRGLIPSRENDCFGIGYYYDSIQTLRLSSLLGIKSSTQGVECFYNIAITPAAHLTLDLQVVESPQKSVHTATVLGLRSTLDF